MHRGRWLTLLLLFAFVAGVMAFTWLRSEQPVPPPVLPPQMPAAIDAGATDSGPSTISAGDGEAEAAGASTAVADSNSLAAGTADVPERARGGVDYLIVSLRTSSAFRVRARAAVMLAPTRAPRVVAALGAALGDPHPAVRTAAASSLGRQGPAVRALLEAALQSERDAKVRAAEQKALARLGAGPKAARAAKQPTESKPGAEAQAAPPTGAPRYYVGIGKPTDPAGSLSASALGRVQSAVRGRVQSMAGVRIAPGGESPAGVRQVLERDGRTGFYLDVSVASISHDPASGTRATVSVMVGSYPGRDMRAMLKGSATLPGGGNDEASRMSAVEGALQSALRKLPAVFAQSIR